MAKRITKQNYDLNASFLDASNNLYPGSAAQNLRFWGRMNEAGPVDLSSSGLSPTYVNNPEITNNLIGANI